jgi:hypothetical protein
LNTIVKSLIVYLRDKESPKNHRNNPQIWTRNFRHFCPQNSMNSKNIRYMEGPPLSLSTKIGALARPSSANSVARILIAAVEKQTGRGARMNGLREQAIAQKML